MTTATPSSNTRTEESTETLVIDGDQNCAAKVATDVLTDDDLTGEDDEHIDDCVMLTTTEAHSAEALFLANQDIIRRLVRRYGHEFSDADRDELYQAGAVRLWKLCVEVTEGREVTSFPAFAWNAVKFGVWTERRNLWKRQQETNLPDVVCIAAESPDHRTPDAMLIQTEELCCIRQSIDQLPEKQRAVIGGLMAGIRVNELAEQLNVVPQTVYSAKSLAVKSLRRMAEDEFCPRRQLAAA